MESRLDEGLLKMDPVQEVPGMIGVIGRDQLDCIGDRMEAGLWFATEALDTGERATNLSSFLSNCLDEGLSCSVSLSSFRVDKTFLDSVALFGSLV